MSIQTDLTRIKNAKAAIKAAIEGKGVPVPDATLLDGMAALIESIESGGGGGENNLCYGENQKGNGSRNISLPIAFIPDILILIGSVSGTSNSSAVGLAVHIQKDDGSIYQEKWRYQSTKYLIGTSVTDGTLFNIMPYSDNSITLKIIVENNSSYGNLFSENVKYMFFAAKLNKGI